jgi:DNA-binding GntR family transcriptional regulator
LLLFDYDEGTYTQCMQQKTTTGGAAASEQESGSARDRAYAYIRDGILRRTIKAGVFLEEEQVSSAIGVSRTPVREAFHRLAAERWLDLVPRRGALVRQVTAQELVDVYEARRVIEGHAVRSLCSARLDVPALSYALLDEMHAEGAGAIETHVRLDQQFHRSLVATLGNVVLIEIYDSLRARQQLVALSAYAANPGRLQTILDEHRALLAALAVHDAKEAEAVLRAHLRPLAEVLARLEGEPPAA